MAATLPEARPDTDHRTTAHSPATGDAAAHDAEPHHTVGHDAANHDAARTDGKRRATSQRSALEAVLAGTDEFSTAAELHESLRAAGARVGLATVYRTLADLVAAGDIDSLRGPAGETLYRRCGDSEHHHHLVCRVCGRTEEVTAPAVERWAKTVAKRYGFTEIGHEIELFGRCAECTAAAQADPATRA